MSAPELAPGRVIDGKFEVQGLLHHGGSIATYRAIMVPNVPVALKFYDPRLESFPHVVTALARVETLANELPSELVLRIVDGGRDPVTGALYTVTHFDPDPSLAEVVGWGALSASEMVTFVQSLGHALDAVHASGVAHLSLKPTNVFVGPGPAYNVRVADFAMSLVHSVLPSSGDDAASGPWLAPEQNGDAIMAGPAADVFAAALLAFYALTGESNGHSRAPVSQRARELSVSLDDAFDSAFARALAVAPEGRFQTVGQFADALAVALTASRSETDRPPIVSASAPAIATSFLAEDAESAAPTSTSAVILAPSLAPDRPAPSSTGMGDAVDVPPPPAQIGAVLAEFETAAPHRFPMGSTLTPSLGTEGPAVHVPTDGRARARSWSPLFWAAGIAAGVLIAAGIVRGIASNKSASAQGQPVVTEHAAKSAAPNPEVAPVAAVVIPQAEPAAAANSAAAREQRTRAAPAPPSTKTVRAPSPTQPRGAASAPRKPCGKGSKPCK